MLLLTRFLCSPTKGGSKLDLITNVKSQMTGWLGSGIPIPGLRKNEVPPAGGEAVEPAPAEPAEPEPKPEGKDDDDNSRYNRYEGFGGSNEFTQYFFFSFFLILFLSLLRTVGVSFRML